MSALLPAAVYGLEVPPDDELVPAIPELPAAFRITMAAIDPTAAPEFSGTADGNAPVRATLKLIRQSLDPDFDDSEEDSEEEDYLNDMLNGAGSEDEDEESSEDDEKNGGPSDPKKTKKARKEAAVEQLKQAIADNDSDDEMQVDATNGVNGIISKARKGKGKVTNDEDTSDDDDDEDSEDLNLEEFVLCTLDPEKHYQQPLDITIGPRDRVFFKVSGTHTIYLTGNYTVPLDGHNRRHEIYGGEEDEEDYDLSPDEDELDVEEEGDELDDIEDPRVTEVHSDDEAEAPKLVKQVKPTEQPLKKGKNKRAAEESDEPAGLDEIMAKSLKQEVPATNGELKLSKKQLKKLKNNAGEAVAAAVEKKDVIQEDSKSAGTPSTKDKKVQFAKILEQGPSGTAAKTKDQVPAEKNVDVKKDTEKTKAGLGVKTVQGVTVDDKKLGTGPAAKKGDRVGMRYIGKLQDGKVFDANKKGKPFSFKLGAGEVIKGWDIGVAGMSVGGERRITIPANLAYGSKSMPGIPSNSQLIFDMKLLEIK